MKQGERGKYQFSVRTMMFTIAAVSALLAPFAWMMRDRQQQRQVLMRALQAREVALRSVVLEEQRRSSLAISRRDNSTAETSRSLDHDPSARLGLESLQRLERENADLRRQVSLLNREVDRLKSQASSSNTPVQ
jgi:type II secretory pathway pseudopilin PulG